MQLIVGFFESMYYHPKWYHKLVSLLLSPVSLIYALVMYAQRITKNSDNCDIPIIGIGNLIIGGSGKTPFAMAIANRYQEHDIAIISRGYGRRSRGLVQVSREGKILTDTDDSGDEAMLMANSLPYASVIVSEDREQAIRLAKKQGRGLILLDDAFRHAQISKLEILLEPAEVKNRFTLPSGPFREFPSTKNLSDLYLTEGKDFSRVVTYKDLTPKMILVTAIANPSRLEQYLPDGVIHKVYMSDHAYFDKEMLVELLDEHKASSLLVTQKDLVKIRDFKLPISQIQLELEINNDVFVAIDKYIGDFDAR